MKSLAIMQPYFFPYIGYWQLIHAVDKFVIYDDVNYITRGWVNRNRILINGEPAYITVPLIQASQNKLILETMMQSPDAWQNKLVRSVANTYGKATYFNEVFPVVEALIRFETSSLADYLAHQLQTLSRFMGITTEFVVSSRCYGNSELDRQERILDICKREGVTQYINAPGGKALYDTKTFADVGIDLRFIHMQSIAYPQRSVTSLGASNFVPYLSIIDALMEVGANHIKPHLDAFELLI